MTVTREEIVSVARRLVGTKYHHQATSQHGVDCVGFIAKVGAEVGIEYEYDKNYYLVPQGDSLLIEVRKFLIEIPVEDAKPGSVLAFKIGGVVGHLGFLAERSQGLSLIHADNRVKRVVEVTYEGLWARLTAFAFDLPNLEEED